MEGCFRKEGARLSRIDQPRPRTGGGCECSSGYWWGETAAEESPCLRPAHRVVQLDAAAAAQLLESGGEQRAGGLERRLARRVLRARGEEGRTRGEGGGGAAARRRVRGGSWAGLRRVSGVPGWNVELV